MFATQGAQSSPGVTTLFGRRERTPLFISVITVSHYFAPPLCVCVVCCNRVKILLTFGDHLLLCATRVERGVSLGIYLLDPQTPRVWPCFAVRNCRHPLHLLMTTILLLLFFMFAAATSQPEVPGTLWHSVQPLISLSMAIPVSSFPVSSKNERNETTSPNGGSIFIRNYLHIIANGHPSSFGVLLY